LDWYLAVLKKYAVFDGRARRQEYWMFVLFNFIISFALGIMDAITGIFSPVNWIFASLGWIYSLAILIPSLAVSVRRLHDTGRSGWWLLLGLIPLIGFIVLLIFYVEDSQPGNNQYGPNPKEVPAPFQQTGTGLYCRNCGAQLPPGAGFCQNCGAKT
jgi:uncharacterized membrane protein YhaH (DUF805 family)